MAWYWNGSQWTQSHWDGSNWLGPNGEITGPVSLSASLSGAGSVTASITSTGEQPQTPEVPKGKGVPRGRRGRAYPIRRPIAARMSASLRGGSMVGASLELDYRALIEDEEDSIFLLAA